MKVGSGLVEFLVDLVAPSVRLVDPDDTTTFAVRVTAPADAAPPTSSHRLGDVLATSSVGRLSEEETAFIDPGAISFRAAGQVGPDWRERFVAMLALAAARGWVDPGTGAVAAQVVWPEL